MPDALLRPPDGAFGHVEVVVGVGAVTEELGQELQPFDAVDRVAEVFDAAREVENHNERRVDLVGSVGAQTRTLSGEGVCQVLELRRESLALSSRSGLG